jgi:hypothetical protein
MRVWDSSKWNQDLMAICPNFALLKRSQIGNAEPWLPQLSMLQMPHR